ncbi:death-associated protein 1 [Limosa lapponica baueri]|uniref:Death-associated protein 1 n=1 Tax=Limosa lapponica baueri TaxID=1758121 RepID=A0A2I0U7U2_LIMLA|nr:death-associated protein 1 [Limosa lapponica baueri]
MVSTRSAATVKRNKTTQTDLPQRHAAVQVTGCMDSLSLLQEDSKDRACVCCEQGNDLLSVVADLKEEVERLRTIWECESEIDWWSHTLPSLEKKEQVEAP